MLGLLTFLSPCLLLRFFGVFLPLGLDPGRRRLGTSLSFDQGFQFLPTELEMEDLLPVFKVLGEKTLKSFEGDFERRGLVEASHALESRHR